MRQGKPIIGVTTSLKNSYTVWFFIRLAIWLTGGKAIRLTEADYKNYQSCSGYLISGGVDIDPALYGQQNTSSLNIESARDQLEKEVISHALAYKKPLFGICRGAQMINIIRGGTLHQNARDFYDGFVPTDSLLGKIFTRRRITIDHKGLMLRIFKENPRLKVNSLHHQAIDVLGEKLVIVAKDPHGIIQAIESEHPLDHFIIGVQWHPEFMTYHHAHLALFRGLVKAAYQHSAHET